MARQKNGTTDTMNQNGSRKKTRTTNTNGHARISFMDAMGLHRTFTVPNNSLFIQMENRSANLNLGTRHPKLTIFQPKNLTRFTKETITV